jgi:hypothetical protein
MRVTEDLSKRNAQLEKEYVFKFLRCSARTFKGILRRDLRRLACGPAMRAGKTA